MTPAVPGPPPTDAGSGAPVLESVEPGPADPAGGGLARASLAVAAGTLLSRITGLVRVGLLAYAIGRGTLADTYNLANSTPNIVYELVLGGVLSATLVPVFVEHARRRDERATQAVLTVAMTGLLALTALAVVAAPAIARLYTFRGTDPASQQEVATTFIRLFLPQMCFYGITTLATALLNARRRFAAAAFAPVLNNIVVIATILTFVRVTSGPRDDWVAVTSVRDDTGLLLLLGLGTTAGIAAMALVLVPAVVRAGVRLRPRFEWRHAAVRHVVRLSGWTVGYVVANQVALSVVLVLANGERGGVAAYQYAFIFFQLPHGLFAVSIMTTFTPELARYAADGDHAGMADRFGEGLRWLGLVVLPAAAGYLVLAPALVGLMELGAFGARDVVATADTLRGLAVGLPAFSAYLYTLRGFYALQDTRTPFLVNCFENALNIVLALALFPAFGVPGLAYAYAGAYTIAAVVAIVLLRRRLGGLGGPTTLPVLARGALATVALTAVAAVAVGLLPSGSPPASAATLLVATAVGVGVYALSLRLLGVREVAALRRALRPRTAGPGVQRWG